MEGAEVRPERSRPHRPPPPRTVAEDITSFRSLQRCHDNAYKYIEQGLTSDEVGHLDQAKAHYENGLREINKALVVNCEQLQATNDEINTAKQLQQKMNKSKLQIQYRVQAIENQMRPTVPGPIPSAPESMDFEEPPSYEQATSSPGSTVSDSQFMLLGDSVMSDSTDSADSLVANAIETYCIPDGVQIFFITPEGFVSAPSYPSALKIFRFTDQQTEASATERPPAFLQVGEWYYPLVPGTSPVLQSDYGAYLFPDVTAHQQGSAVGLILPETTSTAERQRFEQTLGGLTVLRQQESAPLYQEGSAAEGQTTHFTPERTKTGEATHVAPEAIRDGETRSEEDDSTSTKISKGIMTAAEFISWGVGKGAEKAGQLMQYGSEKIRAHLKPEEKPKPVDPRVQKGVQYVRKGAHVAVQVSSFLVNKLGQATMALAKEAAPHIRKQGEKLIPKSMKESSTDGKSKMDGMLEVAASGLKGFGTVYVSLESAAKALAKNLANETVHVVDHKYGAQAGDVTDNALYAVGNIAMTTYNANHFGVKAIAKRAAKDTGKAVLEDLNSKEAKKDPSGDNKDQGKR